MIDFSKRLDAKLLEKKTHPVEIYDTLDRASDKGPLRPAQEAILNTWYESNRNKKDVIIKLHTGQGKTLVGLLILQSRINEGKSIICEIFYGVIFKYSFFIFFFFSK